MRRTRIILAVVALALLAAPPAAATAQPEEPARPCLDAGPVRNRWYRRLGTPRPGAPALATWVGLRVASWTRSPDPTVEPAPTGPTFCSTVATLGLTEVHPGLAVGRSGATVTVLADRARIAYRAVDGPRRRAAEMDGIVVVNANWFTAAGSEGPVVADGLRSGSADTIERGQIAAIDPACGTDGTDLRHVWTGELYQQERCTVTAVSGVSLVHKGERADAYPGITLTTGYTNTARAHSFLGFDETSLFVVATTEMTASELADYALSLGVEEGVMLDGGGSTQIVTPTASITSTRAVPSFVVLADRD